jgi:hypothetical protein
MITVDARTRNAASAPAARAASAPAALAAAAAAALLAAAYLLWSAEGANVFAQVLLAGLSGCL